MPTQQKKAEAEPALDGDMRPPLRIMVVYADESSRDDALLLSQRLLRQVGNEMEIELTWWRFDFLADAHVCRRAAMMARLSDIVVFSVHQQHELPSHVQAWIDQWVRQRSNPQGALGAMGGWPAGPNKSPSPIHFYLREVARCARMDFLANVSALPALADYSTQALRAQPSKSPSHN